MVQGISGELNNASYGNIQRVGSLPNGRTTYRVIDANGREAGRLSVPNDQRDTFEKAYNDIMESAPKIQQFAREHSSKEDRASRLNKSRAIITSCGLIGAITPLYMLRNSNSAAKQIISSVSGILAGILTGFCISMEVNSPPGTLKFAKASHQLSKIDIQPVNQYIA